VAQMIKSLDVKHEKYQKEYFNCYQMTCKSIYEKIKG